MPNHNNDNAPVVLVGGFLTRNTTSYWGEIEQFFQEEDNRRDIIIAPVGACSSLHDRACEIFYSLKGGKVDYGAEHAIEHNHGRYGRYYAKGSYPQWSIEHPVHFVTHSLGGPTVLKLISLLRTNFFGDEYHPDMVRSVFSVAAPFKGTPTVYLLGASYEGHKNLRLFSIGNLIAKYIHISSFLGPLLSPNLEAFDFQPDARNLGIFSLPHRLESGVVDASSSTTVASNEWMPRRTWRGLKRSVASLLSNLRTSEWADSVDSGAYDSTCHAAHAREEAGDHGLNANTFYCSLTGTISAKQDNSPHHRPDREFKSDMFMYIMSKMVGSFSYNLTPLPSFLLAKPTITSVTTTAASPPLTLAGRNKRRTLVRRRLERRDAALAINTTLTSTSTTVAEDESLSSALGMDWSGDSSPEKADTPRPSLSSSFSSGFSGSSGWQSSRSTSSSSSAINTPDSDVPMTRGVEETTCTWPATSHVRSTSAYSTAAVAEGSEDGEDREDSERPGHHRRWSSTDWYAYFATNWSSVMPQTPITPTTPTTATPVTPTAANTTVSSEVDEASMEPDLDEVVRSHGKRRGVAPGLLAMRKNQKKELRHEVVLEEEETKDNIISINEKVKEDETKVKVVEGERRLRDDLWENDGVVPIFSQVHPSECSIHHCQHHGDLSLDTTTTTTSSKNHNDLSMAGNCNNLRIGAFDKGVWHVFNSRGLSHNTFVGGLGRYEARRSALWTKISDAIRDLDLHASAHLREAQTTFMVTPPSP